MKDTARYLDGTSWIIIIITLVLFVTAVFVKGLGHDVLLEAGVFLVSVKLILMSFKHSVTNERMRGALQELAAQLARIEGRLGPGARPDQAAAEALPEGGANAQQKGTSRGIPS